MNDVVAIKQHLPYAEQVEKYGFVPFNHQKPQWFDVSLQPIYDRVGKVIPGHKRVERADTGDTLAVHTDKYSLVPYRQHFEAFEAAIATSALDSTGMLVGCDLSDHGAKIFRQYLFPAISSTVTTRFGTRTVAFRIYMFDSYDGSLAFQGVCGFFDFVCANESVFGTEVDRIRFKHVGDIGAKVKDAAERLTSAGERFMEQMRRLANWPHVAVPSIQFSGLVNCMPQSNPRLVDQLTADYARQGGETLWDAHTCLSSWATHGVPAKIKADRQKRLGALIEDPTWIEMEQ